MSLIQYHHVYCMWLNLVSRMIDYIKGCQPFPIYIYIYIYIKYKIYVIYSIYTKYKVLKCGGMVCIQFHPSGDPTLFLWGLLGFLVCFFNPSVFQNRCWWKCWNLFYYIIIDIRCYLNFGDIDRGHKVFEEFMSAGNPPIPELYTVSLGLCCLVSE